MIAFDATQSTFVYLSIATYDGVFPFWNSYADWFPVRIEQDDDVVPRISSCVILQAEANDTRLCGQELHIAPNKVGISET